VFQNDTAVKNNVRGTGQICELMRHCSYYGRPLNSVAAFVHLSNCVILPIRP
jgi:hypothetical protein